ncbi:MAG: hypothetical protein IJ079_06290 [Lachnospiraceae bacterium]|nr:hypothetical protein [Lachnospiraceae bacterium]
MTDNELLLAMSEMMDKKIKPIEDKTNNIELLLENNVIPRIQNIEACYTSTYRRYSNGIEQLDAIQSDIDIIKKVITEHSEKIQELQKLA